jgi:thiamine-monophosphate kinase
MPDEREVIESIVRKAGRAPTGYAAIGDDVGVVPAGGRKLVVKVDMLVEGTDVPPGMSYRQAARKAVAMCVSDFAAKGVKPDSFLISLGLKRGVKQEQVAELGEGIRDAELQWKICLVGGDTSETRELIVDCTMFGFAKKIVPRDGARPREILAVTGTFGYPPAGLRILAGGMKADRRFAEKARASVLEPAPNLKVGLALREYFTSAMDSSDGLARSLHTLADASGVGFRVERLPEGEGVAKFAKENGLDQEALVLVGGEEYLIVGTLRPETFGRAARAARKAGGTLLRIGKTTESRKVELAVRGETRLIRDEGWTHLG